MLGRADGVIGPSEDGGYYLIGLRAACPALFAGVPWSTDRVLATTLRRARRAGRRLRRCPRGTTSTRPTTSVVSPPSSGPRAPAPPAPAPCCAGRRGGSCRADAEPDGSHGCDIMEACRG